MESEFLKMIAERPDDWAPRLVLADWLEEQGDPRAEMIRLQHQLLNGRWGDPTAEAPLLKLISQGVIAPCPRMFTPQGMELVLLPPGMFLMGSPSGEAERRRREGPVKVLLTQGFWIGRFTVSQSEWNGVTGTTPWSNERRVQEGMGYSASHLIAEDATKFCETLTTIERAAGRLPLEWEYCLPTEAQWEYACRAGTSTRFSFGDDIFALTDFAWFRDNARGIGEDYAHRVGQKHPNAWGLYDMHGNLWEWCRDWYAEELRGGSDPEVVERAKYRVRRGGCWFSPGSFFRSAYRTGAPGYPHDDFGFRIACVQVRN